MAEQNKYVDNKNGDTKKKIVKSSKIKDPTFKEKLRDAFISDEVHDVKDHMVFNVVIPAIKETLRNLVVNTVDMTLFGKIRTTKPTEQRGGSTYIQYDRAYNSPQDYTKQSRPQSGAPIRVTELDRIVFADKNDAIEVLNYLFENVEEYHVASVADFLGAANQQIQAIHHKWGWYSLNGSSVEQLPDGGYVIRLPRPQSI